MFYIDKYATLNIPYKRFREEVSCELYTKTASLV